MGKRTSYEPGTFSWVELSTTDPDAAKEFYGGLFGWTAEDSEVPGGGVYSMMKLGDDYAGAIQRKPEQQDALPPYWFNYVTVASADEAAAAAKEAGGTVHMDPFDVMDAGRMTVIMDPTGGAFGVWEPKDHIGAGVVNVHGALTWNELATNDGEQAAEFYGELFGWSIEEADTGGGPRYWLIGHPGAASGRGGGMRELTEMEEGVPPHWAPYFAVDSIETILSKAGELGGSTVVPPTEVPAGRFAIVRDPQGAVFGIVESDFDD